MEGHQSNIQAAHFSTDKVWKPLRSVKLAVQNKMRWNNNGDKEVPIHTYASSLGGDTSSKVLALRLSHLVDGSRLEAIELAEGRSLRRKTWIKRERMSQDVNFFEHIVLPTSIETIQQ